MVAIPSMTKVLGIMLVVSTWRLSAVTLNDFCRRFEPRLMVAGGCALPQRNNSTDKTSNHIRRKSLNSREFMLKIVKFAYFIALKLLTPPISQKKRQI